MSQEKELGNGNGLGGGKNSSAGGRGRNNGGGFGTGGICVCTSCGYKSSHDRGVKCATLKCPKCGKPMIREELL